MLTAEAIEELNMTALESTRLPGTRDGDVEAAKVPLTEVMVINR